MRAPFGKRDMCLLALGGFAWLIFFAHAACPIALGQDSKELKPKVSDAPLSADQLAIYHAVVHEWGSESPEGTNLSMFTSLPRGPIADSNAECLNGHEFESVSMVHRIRNEDLSSIAHTGFHLVDPDEHARVVIENDPQRHILNEKDIGKAVDNGFAKGLFTFSEVRFDKTHEFAVVSFSFWCGSLCGHGQTWVLKKTDGNWRKIKTCGVWIS